MAGAFMIAFGVLLVIVAMGMVLSDKEPDGTTREGIAGAKRRRSKR
jgi:small neutral amino acid transporter SnatA (MarC family)